MDLGVRLQSLYPFYHTVLFLPRGKSTFHPWRQPLIYAVFLLRLRTMLWTALKNSRVTISPLSGQDEKSCENGIRLPE